MATAFPHHLQSCALLRDSEVLVRLDLSTDEAARQSDLLRAEAGRVAAARDLVATLRPRVEALQRQETYATARREFDADGEVWTYALSVPTRACQALIAALDAVVAEAAAADRAA